MWLLLWMASSTRRTKARRSHPVPAWQSPPASTPAFPSDGLDSIPTPLQCCHRNNCRCCQYAHPAPPSLYSAPPRRNCCRLVPPSRSHHTPNPLSPSAVPTPSTPPTRIPYQRRRLNIVDVFVDDFIGAAQGGPKHLKHVRRTLMTAIDDVFQPLQPGDPIDCTEPISTKKFLQGDASWSKCKKILGWIIDSVSMMITGPERRLNRLAELLAAIPRTQKPASSRRGRASLANYAPSWR
jgi:hypothetical protein